MSVTLLSMLITPSSGQLFTGNNGRIAVTADGNIHDQDDFGATPVSLAILAKSGLQSKLVHYDYSSHIGESTANGEEQMRISALGAQSRFGFNRSVFFDDIANIGGAVNNLKNAINASSAGNRLFVILAGPSEVLWRGMNAADQNKRTFVTVISHSFFNEFHANDAHTGQPNHGQPNHRRLRRTITNVRNLGASFRRIANQNDYWNTHLGGRGSFGALSWMENHQDENLRWVFTRIRRSGRADYSDAGMVYFLITGDDTANTAAQRNFFAGAFPPVGGNNSGLPAIGSTISLKGNNNRYVSSENGRAPMRCNRNNVGTWEKFRVVDAGSGRIALRGFAFGAANNRFISSENGNAPINCNRSALAGWERFTVRSTGNNQISLQGNNGRYISSENGNRAMTCTRNSVSATERFTWRTE